MRWLNHKRLAAFGNHPVLRLIAVASANILVINCCAQALLAVGTTFAI